MNILITGSEGFVGTKMQVELKKSGHEVTTLDRLNSNYSKHFVFELGKDSIDSLVMELTSENIELIIHLAAAKGDFLLSDDDFFNDNVLATAALVKLCDSLAVFNLIHYSTVSVYGHNNVKNDETANISPNNPYGITKLESEKLVINWQKTNISNNLTILRPSVIYGVNNFANMYNLLSQLNNKLPIMVGDGNYVKSIIALDNLIDLTEFVITEMNALQIYNCTDEPYPKLKEIYGYVSEVDGFRTPKVKIPYILALTLATPFDLISNLIKKDLKITRERVYKFKMPTDFRSDLIRSKGYRQKYSTKDQLQKMAHWFLKINKR